ncbi:MAG: NAD-dependent epimerase/dehydratase family protein, partial [Thauera sp.]|nr:NAD-dependent epimerase/dehydratase family protein [Thauera sp.]
LATYRAVNTAGTLALARQAAAAGVKRFILLSTIKVHGEATAPGSAFSASSPLDPQDPYAQSKAEAELGLRELAADSAMEIVILRPPLVYGPGVKANFARLLRAVERGWPLPLGRLTENRRSLLAVDNLVDLIRRCLDHPAAAGQAFVACDGEDLSTAALLQRLARANGRSLRLLPVPVALLQTLARLSDRSGGRSASFARLSDNLQVDMRATCALLGWQPPLDVDHALRACFANNHR